MFDVVLNTPLRASLLNYVPYVPSRLTRLTRSTRLRAFTVYAPSCLTYLRALRALIFTRLNYAPCAHYLLFARLTCYLRALFTNDKKSLMKENFENVVKGNLKGAVFEI